MFIYSLVRTPDKFDQNCSIDQIFIRKNLFDPFAFCQLFGSPKNVRKLDKIFTINVMFFICDNSVLKYVKLSSIFEAKSEQSELTKKEIFLKW